MGLLSSLRDRSRWATARLDIRSQAGASAVEYGLMIFLIAAVIIVAVVLLGSQTSRTFSCTGGSVQTSTVACG